MTYALAKTSERPFSELFNEVSAQIQQQVLKPGQRLPSERSLQQQFGCSRITIREALLRLSASGLIYRQPRKGWFVSPPRLVCNPTRRIHFLHDARAQGFSPATELIYNRSEAAPQEVAQALNSPDIQNICRLRRLNDRPVLIENLYLIQQQFPNLEQHCLEGSLTDLLRNHYNTYIAGEEARIISSALQEEQAFQLQVAPGTPAIQIQRTRYNRLGQAVEFDIEFWLHDAIELHVRA